MAVAGEHEPDPVLLRSLVTAELVELFERGIDAPAQTPDLLMAVVAGTVPSNERGHVGEPIDIKISRYRDGDNNYFHVSLASKDGMRQGVRVYNTLSPERGRTTLAEDSDMRDYLSYATFTAEETRLFATEVEGLSLAETGDDFTLGHHPDMERLVTEVRKELIRGDKTGNIVTRGLWKFFSLFGKNGITGIGS